MRDRAERRLFPERRGIPVRAVENIREGPCGWVPCGDQLLEYNAVRREEEKGWDS